MISFLVFIFFLVFGSQSFAAENLIQEEDEFQTNLYAHIFSRFDQVKYDNGSNINEFSLPRGDFGVGAGNHEFYTNLRVQSFRSATKNSLMGLDGNSFVLRLRHFILGYHFDIFKIPVTITSGLVPDLWTSRMIEAVGFSEITSPMTTKNGFTELSDVGFISRLGLVRDFLDLSIQVTNGEGMKEAELNEGKNISARLDLHILKNESESSPALSVSLFGREGSRGISSAKDHRFATMFDFSWQEFNSGLSFIYADGKNKRSNLKSNGLTAWIDYGFLKDYGLFAKTEKVLDNIEEDESFREKHFISFYRVLGSDLKRLNMRFHINYSIHKYGAMVDKLSYGEVLNHHQISFIFSGVFK